MKVCSLYGAGFYYIPGTDTCIKIGGFVRAEWDHNAAGSFAPYVDGTNGLYTRDGNVLNQRARGVVTFDTRSQTEFGTLRSYLRAGWQWTTNDPTVGGSAGTVYLDRAFIQIAGFTFGKSQSFFDFFCTGCYSLQTNVLFGDNGGAGTPMFAYTAQLGNGVTATLSLEEASIRKSPLVALNGVTAGLGVVAGTGAAGVNGNLPFALGLTNAASNSGNMVPDIVANLRVDQAWGSAQVSGALHLNQATYYAVAAPGGATTQTQGNGHPDDEWGWAASAGLTLKMPWDSKDTLSGQIQYCEGATRYCISQNATTGDGLFANLVNTNTIAAGWSDDGYFGAAGTQIDLAQVFSVVGAFEHYWTSNLRSSVYGAYASYDTNSAQVDAICTAAAGGARGCFNWDAWQVGSRTLWNPVANLDIGLDIIYTKIDGADCARRQNASAAALATSAVQCSPAAVVAPTPISSALNLGSTDVVSAVLRVQRNFWP